VGAQAAAERVHGPDQVFILPSQLFLPDRKNRLASLQSLAEKLLRLFLHFRGCHPVSPFPPRLRFRFRALPRQVIRRRKRLPGRFAKF